MLPVIACGVKDIGDAVRHARLYLARIPHVIPAAVADHRRPVYVFYLSCVPGGQHDPGGIKGVAVPAFGHCNAPFVPPGKIHTVARFLPQHAYVEANAVIAAQDGVAGVLYPAALLFRLVHFHHLSAVVIHPRWIRNTGGGLPGVFFRTGREYLSG